MKKTTVLVSYVPNDEWEKVVDKLYEVAEQKIKYLIEKRKMAEKQAFLDH